MSLFLVVLFVAVFIGIGFVLYALYAFARDKDNEGKDALSYLEVDNTIKAIDSSVREADDAMEQLDKMARSIFEEMDGKYQELLFLYTMIDEKKNEIKAFHTEMPYKKRTEPSLQEYRNESAKRAAFKNPYLDKINELTRSGMSVTEIAKDLNMGQGEVKLIMEMGKVR